MFDSVENDSQTTIVFNLTTPPPSSHVFLAIHYYSCSSLNHGYHHILFCLPIPIRYSLSLSQYATTFSTKLLLIQFPHWIVMLFPQMLSTNCITVNLLLVGPLIVLSLSLSLSLYEIGRASCRERV